MISSESYSGSASKGKRCVPLASSLQADIKFDSLQTGLIEGTLLTELSCASPVPGPLMFCRSKERAQQSIFSRSCWQAFRLSSRQRLPQ